MQVTFSQEEFDELVASLQELYDSRLSRGVSIEKLGRILRLQEALRSAKEIPE